MVQLAAPKVKDFWSESWVYLALLLERLRLLSEVRDWGVRTMLCPSILLDVAFESEMSGSQTQNGLKPV